MTEATLMTDAPNTTVAQTSTTAEVSATVAPVEGQTQQTSEVKAPEGDQPQGDKPAGDKPADDKTESDKATPGAPDSYEFALPDGVQMDDAGIASFSEFAKDSNLTQEAAQALLGKMAPAMQARQAAQMEANKADWKAQSQADTEFGGAKLAENVAFAQKAMKQFGTPELSALLEKSGLGNHPEMLRVFYRAGKAISEDGSFVGGGSKASGRETAAKTMFPSMN